MLYAGGAYATTVLHAGCTYPIERRGDSSTDASTLLARTRTHRSDGCHTPVPRGYDYTARERLG